MSATGDHLYKPTTVLTRISIIISIAAWTTYAALICLNAAGDPLMPDTDLDIVSTWLGGTGALTLILSLSAGADRKIMDLVSKALRVGDTDLDTMLLPAPHRRWRANPAVGTALTHLAAIAWTLSLIFSIQLGFGVYHLPAESSAELLRLMMACAVWPTVLAVSGRIEARRIEIFNVACDLHRDLRGIAAPCETTLNIKRLTVVEGGEPRRRRGLYRLARTDDPTSAPGA